MSEGEEVNVVYVTNTDQFQYKTYVKENRFPAVFKGLDIGNATSLWTADYLCEKLGNTPVTIHVAKDDKMNFMKKNFLYKTLPFDEFVRRASRVEQDDYFVHNKEKYYLRSQGNNVRKDPSDVRVQFPFIAGDIKFPQFFDESDYFSSVFRISSYSLQIWTHYDIMDNILMHLVGRKRVVLYPPSDALNLYLIGDKSEVVDMDNPDYEKYPKFRNATKYECILEPGDVLFIPAMWFHNITTLDFSISVNVFWKNLQHSFYDSKDVYGNKDLLPAQRAFQGVDKALKTLQELPDEYANFFARRLISHIENKLTNKP